MAGQVFAFARVEDDNARRLVYEEIEQGRSRFGMWDQAKSLKEEYFGRNRQLLEIRKDDWIVHVNMPESGKCVAVQAAGDYQYDNGLVCSWGRDFNNVWKQDVE